MMRRVSATGSSMIRHIRLPVSLRAVDQPCQCISGSARHEQRGQRVLRDAVGHDALASADISLCIWVLIPDLADIAFASAYISRAAPAACSETSFMAPRT